MRNLLALIGLAVVVFGLVGWYCGWYKVSFARKPDGKLEIQTDLDTRKVSDDSAAFFEKVGKVLGDRAEKSGPPAATPGATPAPVDGKRPAVEGGWLFPAKPADR
ncbi:MAG: hypothetical protein C0501_19315 [Isosphaera sp.]|nr:hypothetical protein [Isosphaera sp.]